MRVITNNQPRLLIDGYTLPESLFAEGGDLDYTTQEDFVGFRYRGELYDVSEAAITDMAPWQGVFNETFFSSVVFRYAPDDIDRVVVGHMFS